MKDSADRPAVFTHRCLQPPFREITWCPSRVWARARSRVAAMRNLMDALGQQPVDGAEWHWQRSCNVAPVRQREGTLDPPTRRTERIGSRACIECLGLGVFRSTYPEHLFRRWSSQQLVSLVVVTWRSMLPKALPPFQVLGLALFSLSENCLRARMKLGTRDVPEQRGPDRRWHI